MQKNVSRTPQPNQSQQRLSSSNNEKQICKVVQKWGVERALELTLLAGVVVKING